MTTESDAERLENMSPIGVDNDGKFLVNSEDWFWLQEQAERAQELEKSIKGYALAVEIYSEMPVKQAMEKLINLAREEFE